MPNNPPIWKQIFLQLAKRAVNEVHNRYAVWSLGQKSEFAIQNFEDLNVGNGILFAPETHVRDAISQQIIELGLFKEHTIAGELRSYIIDREFYINVDGENKSVDLTIKRIQPQSAITGKPTIPVLIEAKRYKGITTKLGLSKFNNPVLQRADIIKDIAKLKSILNVIRKKGVKIDDNGGVERTYYNAHLCILLWGEETNNFTIKQLITNLNVADEIVEGQSVMEYIPLTWEEVDVVVNNVTTKRMAVKKFFWIALLEVRPFSVVRQIKYNCPFLSPPYLYSLK